MSSPTKFGSFSLLINFISFISFNFNYFNLSLNKFIVTNPPELPIKIAGQPR